MPRTLRGKLLASYLAVIAICLALAGSLGILWVQRYERDAALTQARLAAQGLDHILQALPEDEDRKPAVLLSYLRSEAFATDSELLFLDRNGVILRSEPSGSLESQRAPVVPSSNLQREDASVPLRRWTLPDKSSYYVLYVSLPPLLDNPSSPPQAGVQFVALAVPARDVERPWKEWIPPLVGIGVVAVVVSALVSYLLFGSLTRPLDAMTRAAEEIASGHYGHHIPGQSQDEVGRLAIAFNHMAREVERAQRAQRDFMVNISHDLQTPLTSIRGFSQAIVDGAIRDVDGLRRAGKIIHDESSRMAEILRSPAGPQPPGGGPIRDGQDPGGPFLCIARMHRQVRGSSRG